MNGSDDKKLEFMQWAELMTHKHEKLTTLECQNSKKLDALSEDLAATQKIVSYHDEALRDLSSGMKGMVKAQEDSNKILEKMFDASKPLFGLFDFFEGVGFFVKSKAFWGMITVLGVMYGVSKTEILTMMGVL